ncbi:MAG: pyridoxal-phosphate-dependent aminotransferase family protein [Gaiellaceae bacterium]
MLEKRYLMTPGPTPVPPEVLLSMAPPVIHHRGADFRRVFVECSERLKQVYRTENDVVMFAASGTGGMESAVANLCAPGDRVVVHSAGNFGERWVKIAKAYGCEVGHVREDWGAIPDPAKLAAELDKGAAKVVYLTHSETSTGVVSDLQALAAVAKERGALVAVDAISSLGAVPLETDAWGLDVVVSGSQKALMTPPGLATVSVSDAAAEAAAQEGRNPSFYFNWAAATKALGNETTAFTPALTLVIGLNVALGMLLEAGLEARHELHRKLGLACREGIKAMGLELFSPDADRSAVVTAVKAPAGIDGQKIVSTLRDRFAVQLIGGQGELKGKIFRIGHIGYYDVFDITTALGGLELVLAEMGADVKRGVAVTRALEAFDTRSA